MNKSKSKKIFFNYVKNINKLIGHSNTTFSDELNKIGKHLFKNKFKGVYPADQIPKLGKNKYCILNLDKSNEQGSHWIALANDRNGNTYIYDSFGRSSKKIIPSLYNSGNGKIKDTDKNPEQRLRDNNCGQLSLGFLKMFDKYGPNITKFI